MATRQLTTENKTFKMPDYDINIEYQNALASDGGSYTENKLVRLALPELKGKRFLDLGCNTGFYCRWAHQQGARSVVGVDNSSHVITKARSQSPDGILFRDTGWDDFPHGSYDVVLLASAIHYAKDPSALVRNIRHSLVDDGLLVLEGGVFFMDEDRATDIPLPGWRSVGDRCLHLTKGFVKRHLLKDFQWVVKGASEMRGGDRVPRYVVHAQPVRNQNDEGTFALDLCDYFAAAKYSAETIVESQPAYYYVAPLKNAVSIDGAYVSAVLSRQTVFDVFQADLDFCLQAVNPMLLRLHNTVATSVLSKIASSLSGRMKVELLK
jgi:hypothetical protein